LQILVLILGICIFAVVAYGDIRTRRIPNELVVAILALAAFRIALARDPSAALYTLAASVALFAATFLLFWRGLLGGGDVKLLVATGFLIGYHDLFQFLFVMSICGALVALAVVAHNRLGGAAAAGALEHQEPPEPPEPPARLTVPYGVAISVAGIVTLLAQSFPLG
jgi:prepilin peptidase CpaA